MAWDRSVEIRELENYEKNIDVCFGFDDCEHGV